MGGEGEGGAKKKKKKVIVYTVNVFNRFWERQDDAKVYWDMG